MPTKIGENGKIINKVTKMKLLEKLKNKIFSINYKTIIIEIKRQNLKEDYDAIIKDIKKIDFKQSHSIIEFLYGSAFDIKKYRYDAFASRFMIVYLCKAYGKKSHLFLSSSKDNVAFAVPIQIIYDYGADRKCKAKRELIDFSDKLFDRFKNKVEKETNLTVEFRSNGFDIGLYFKKKGE